jgi:hypothetical protein
MFLPFLTSLTKLIPVLEESSLVNKLFSLILLEQFVKVITKNENKTILLNIIGAEFG